MPSSLDAWIQRESIAFDDVGIDAMLAAMPDVEILGFGEALHGGEEILVLRNRLFQRLVERHGFRAIAIESTFPQARHVNDFIAGHGEKAKYGEWISNGMGLLDANRELIEWMRQYNAYHDEKLHFYGFDMPLGNGSFASPRFILEFVGDPDRKGRIEALIGDDAEWETMAVIADPSQGVGRTPRATELRIEIDDLITEIRTTHPGRSESLHYAMMCRGLLAAHAALAREGRTGNAEMLGIRDAIMADNLEHILSCERDRGRVLVFAHNSHLKRGKASWQMGTLVDEWWPAGSHMSRILGARYAVIGTGVGVSEENGIGPPEAGTLESFFTEAVLVATTHAPATDMPVRSGSVRNPTYFPWTRDSFRDFDWLAYVPSATYQRGGPPLQAWDTK
jgi:erythromycin esterase-like protein